MATVPRGVLCDAWTGATRYLLPLLQISAPPKAIGSQHSLQEPKYCHCCGCTSSLKDRSWPLMAGRVI